MIKDQIKKIYKAKIINTEKVSTNSYYIEIDCNKEIEARAGQFVSIYCEGLTFRRPFSIFTNNKGKIGILYKERGKGTKYIKSLKKGESIDISGPLGNSFSIKNCKSLLIGAGIGTAPISFLKSKLENENIENIFIAGFLNKNEIPKLINPNIIYTDDGSFGKKGNVLSDTEEIIKKYKPEIIYGCGPEIVLKKTSELGERYNIETQISLEKLMACSIGVCRGCVIDIKHGTKTVNASVCKDGPVFWGNEVIWK